MRRRGVPRGVARRSESVKLRGNSTGRVPPCGVPRGVARRSAAFRIRQAKGELHTMVVVRVVVRDGGP